MPQYQPPSSPILVFLKDGRTGGSLLGHLAKLFTTASELRSVATLHRYVFGAHRLNCAPLAPPPLEYGLAPVHVRWRCPTGRIPRMFPPRIRRARSLTRERHDRAQTKLPDK